MRNYFCTISIFIGFVLFPQISFAISQPSPLFKGFGVENRTHSQGHAVSRNGVWYAIDSRNSLNDVVAWRGRSNFPLLLIPNDQFGIGHFQPRAVSFDGSTMVGTGWTAGTEVFTSWDILGEDITTNNAGDLFKHNFGQAVNFARGYAISDDGLTSGGVLSFAGDIFAATAAPGVPGNVFSIPEMGDECNPLFEIHAGHFQALSGDGSIAAGWINTQFNNCNNIEAAVHEEASNQDFRLPDLPGGATVSFAYDISNDGTVIVGAGTDTTGTIAVRWKDNAPINNFQGPEDTVEVIGRLPGDAISWATSVSDNGRTIVGVGGPSGFCEPDTTLDCPGFKSWI